MCSAPAPQFGRFFEEKEKAAPTFKRALGFIRCARSSTTAAPGTGESLAMLLRPGNAGSNTAADHITVLASALAQLPCQLGNRVGKKVLVRTDAAGATHEFLNYVCASSTAVSSSISSSSKRRSLSTSPPSIGASRLPVGMPSTASRRSAPQRLSGHTTAGAALAA
jgi:hypothetical protein